MLGEHVSDGFDCSLAPSLLHVEYPPFDCINRYRDVVVAPFERCFIYGDGTYVRKRCLFHCVMDPIEQDRSQGFLVTAEEAGRLGARDVRHDEHGIPLKHESESAVLPFERSVHLHDAALIAQHLGPTAMDIAGIE